MSLAGKELEVLNTWRTLSSKQGRSATVKHVAEAMGVSWTYASVVFVRLVKKGSLEHLGINHYREPLPPSQSSKGNYLTGTSRDRLMLHIELTGHTPNVIEEIDEAIARLAWFKKSLEGQMKAKTS